MFRLLKKKYILLSTVALLSIVGCGEIFDTVEDRPTPPADEISFKSKGRYVDSNVSGIEYRSKSECRYVEQENSEESKEVCKNILEGNTTADGTFGFIVGGDGVHFYVADLFLDYIAPKYLINNSVVTVTDNNAKLASFLQSMDNDGNASNGIDILPKVVGILKDLNVSKYNSISNTELDIATLVSQINLKLDSNGSRPSNEPTDLTPVNTPINKEKSSSIKLRYVDEIEALSHLRETIAHYKTAPSITVEKVIEDIKNLDKNAQSYSEEEILEKIKAIRRQLDNPLEGDRGLVDIQIAQALLDLSELSNQTYLEDVFVFEGDTNSRLSQIIKEMTLNPDNSEYQPLVRGKDENATNIIDVSKKATLGVITNLKSISDKLGASLATLPQHYKFEYEELSIGLDNIAVLRATLLALASKMSLSLAYNVGVDSNYIPQNYTDATGSKYQFTDVDVYMDKLLNTQGFGKATEAVALSSAKGYLLESAMILKDLTASSIRLDLNETQINDITETNDNQELIDYTKKLYRVLSEGNGTFTITNEHGGDNGEKEEMEIALNRMFDIKTALKSSDWGTNWSYTCRNGLKLGSEDEAKIHNEQMCFQEFNGNRYPYGGAELNASTPAQAETSGLDELVSKITLNGSTVKTGQEVMDYLFREKKTSLTTAPYQPKFTYENVAGKTYHAIHERTAGGTEFRFSGFGINTLSGYDIASGTLIFENASFTITDGHLFVSSLDFELLQENVNGQYEYGKFTRSDNTGDNVRFFYNKNNALAYLSEKRDFSLMGSDRRIIFSPNGGENITKTQRDNNITWDNSKITGSEVNIYILEDDSSDLYNYVSDVTKLIANKNWKKLGVSLVPNEGFYSIQASEINTLSGNAYIVLITSTDEQQWDVSDATFSIN